MKKNICLTKIWADTEKDVKPILEAVAAEKAAAEKK